ncbi:MAG: MBOAT family protein [Oscillospiraceae bacterium]|jgi:alginate O-acetyltransferase complex protein AlgI|nr:MBOAT family protein [Oscillospiraceae bacterium]
MVFSSLIFLYIFFPLCALIYFTVPKQRGRNIALCLSSMIFYAWGEPLWVVLLVFSALVDYVNSKIIDAHRGAWQAKAALVASIVINLGLLFTFKYLDFFLSVFGWVARIEAPVVGLTLPIGISFYTFQTMSYTIDVYRNNVKVQHSFMNFLLFVSLFPQLIAGPIVRYSEIAEQIDERTTTLPDMAAGLTRFMTGLGKKVLIANFAGATAESILTADLAGLSCVEAWIGILCFTFQIYFDFSGYSDMAIGLGRFFGFRYGENFRHPYIARSITEFWRRWHISLGTFFRDYLYIPLGGNRRRQMRNILIVWFLTGLWHGASWNFVLWGLYFGALLLLEKYCLQGVLRKLKWGAAAYTFLLVVLGWVLFYFTDLSRAFAFVKVLFGGGVPFDARARILLLNNLPLLVLCAVASTPLGVWAVGKVRVYAQTALPRAACTAVFLAGHAGMLFLCTASLVGASYNPFLYFRF